MPGAAKSGPEAVAQFARTEILLIGLKVVPCAQRSDAWFVGVSFFGAEHQLRWAQIVERLVGFTFILFFGNLKGLKRRMIAIAKTISFYLLQNV